ncbi:MAG: hypothetical protein KKA19_03435 [Candidatus Margulisbacteria bacterium]|nr:hypothetical protein [Candidatus Margulisiibacteriota bacterium]
MQKKYDFLCESCHPSFLRLTNWRLTKVPNDLWHNELFKENMDNLITETLSIMLQALNGINLEVEFGFKEALPYIKEDQENLIS